MKQFTAVLLNRITCALTLLVSLGCSNSADAFNESSLVSFIKKNQRVSVERGEFETWDQTLARLAYLERPVILTLTPRHRERDPLYSYDAAAGVLSVFLPSSYLPHGSVFDEKRPDVTAKGGWDAHKQWLARTSEKYAYFDLQTTTSKSSYMGQNVSSRQGVPHAP